MSSNIDYNHSIDCASMDSFEAKHWRSRLWEGSDDDDSDNCISPAIWEMPGAEVSQFNSRLRTWSIVGDSESEEVQPTKGAESFLKPLQSSPFAVGHSPPVRNETISLHRNRRVSWCVQPKSRNSVYSTVTARTVDAVVGVSQLKRLAGIVPQVNFQHVTRLAQNSSSVHAQIQPDANITTARGMVQRMHKQVKTLFEFGRRLSVTISQKDSLCEVDKLDIGDAVSITTLSSTDVSIFSGDIPQHHRHRHDIYSEIHGRDGFEFPEQEGGKFQVRVVTEDAPHIYRGQAATEGRSERQRRQTRAWSWMGIRISQR
ncbi:hypothetical protein HDU83_002311 [Entophlyctis luteolus]|nr:hypothetical protein HDU83_002311 [Entophlyctis luteolus]KAJ3380309.1 hypothetical protein HDU84_006032 [Entophlyctis sp. JEL0112]